LADEKGYADVDSETLQHKRFSNVFAVGDCIGTANAKTAASAGKKIDNLSVFFF
jgi:sulfide:quinone oxidoreductase